MMRVRADGLVRVERGLDARAEDVCAGRAALRRACRAAGIDEPRSLWVASGAGGRLRPAVAVREYLPGGEREVVVDMAQVRCGDALEAELRRAVRGGEHPGDVPIGGFTPYRSSLIWELNRAFWEHADRFMAASGEDYRDAIGGSPDLIRSLVRERAERFCGALRRLRSAREGAELAHLSIGASGIEGPMLFAEELTRAAAAWRVSLEGVRYLVADLSSRVLEAVRAALGDRHGALGVGYVELDLQTPAPPLDAWRGRILHAHVGNLFDNLPADHVEWLRGRPWLVEGQLYLPGAAAGELAGRYGVGSDVLRRTLDGPAVALPERLRGCVADAAQVYPLWRDLYGALRIRERLVACPAAALPGGLMRGPDDGRMALSNDAIDSGLALLGLLHERGVLEVVDIMVTDVRHYADHYRATATFDGSAVEWFNAALFEAQIRRRAPDCTVVYASLAAFGKPQMTRMEVRRSVPGTGARCSARADPLSASRRSAGGSST